MVQFFRQVILLLIAVPLFAVAAKAQSDCHERERQDMGIIAGGTFYMGDLTDNYSLFRNLSFYGGLMYRYSFTPYYALRGQAAFGQLRGKAMRPDVGKDIYGQPWAFSRQMILAEIAAEINFMPINVHELRKKQRWAPYLLGGVGFSVLASESSDPPKDMQQSCAYILMGMGVKYVPWKRITVSAEWVMRKTFSDEVDFYTGPESSTFINKDWIGTVGLTVTYRINQDRPCAAYQRRNPDTSNPLGGAPQ